MPRKRQEKPSTSVSLTLTLNLNKVLPDEDAAAFDAKVGDFAKEQVSAFEDRLNSFAPNGKAQFTYELSDA